MSVTINANGEEDRMDALWGESNLTSKSPLASQIPPAALSLAKQRFSHGRFALFIHWGLYSMLGNVYDGTTYYGISEWIMSPHLANIEVSDYEDLAIEFEPSEFNATKIAALAKHVGMKYIVMTAKHHDGFAMYHSSASKFNTVDATRWKRDPLQEMATATRDAGLGFGIYYSHNQDWIFPGGTGYQGPKDLINPKTGRSYTFQDYFDEKCLPQVEEITTQFGEIDVIWFDTPGKMPQHFVEQLVEVVRKNQPNALISGRVGYGLGDYSTLGDMEIPAKNPSKSELWESVDTTNDSWGYAEYDHNFKSPKEILMRLLSCVARGGTYMINIGPLGDGSIPKEAVQALEAIGPWFQAYGDLVVYGANIKPSPWEHAFPWGDSAVALAQEPSGTNRQQGTTIYLFVYYWPMSGKLHVPGIMDTDSVESISLVSRESIRLSKSIDAAKDQRSENSRCLLDHKEDVGAIRSKSLVFEHSKDGWVTIDIGWPPPESHLVSVIAMKLKKIVDVSTSPNVDSSTSQRQDTISSTFYGVDPEMKTEIPMDFATTFGTAVRDQQRWMEKFGEWKSVTRVHGFVLEGKSGVQINFCVQRKGYFRIHLKYSCEEEVEAKENKGVSHIQSTAKNKRGPRRVVWLIEVKKPSTDAIVDTNMEEGITVSNEQGCSRSYGVFPIGLVNITSLGNFSAVISCLKGSKGINLQSIIFEPILSFT